MNNLIISFKRASYDTLRQKLLKLVQLLQLYDLLLPRLLLVGEIYGHLQLLVDRQEAFSHSLLEELALALLQDVYFDVRALVARVLVCCDRLAF